MFEDEEQQLKNKRNNTNINSLNPSGLGNGSFNYRKSNGRGTLHDNDSVENGSHFTIKNKENYLESNFE